MSFDAGATVLAVDLGKTSCRLRLSALAEDGSLHTVAEASGPGAPGLAEADGARRAGLAIGYALSHFTPAHRTAISHIGMGVAGVEAASPEAVAEFLAAVRTQVLECPDAVASARTSELHLAVITDALAAHAGAFDGGAGALLIVGTGAVLFQVSENGDGDPVAAETTAADTTSVKQVDGWGPWLGDDGSGRWIGQQGLMAVLRAQDGRGPATTLTAAAATLVASPRLLPRWVSEGGAPARQLGRFAPAVLDAALAGDGVAIGIIDRAADLLTETVRAGFAAAESASTPRTISVLGGVAEHALFAQVIAPRLAEHNISIVSPVSDQLAGAALIAVRTDLPLESKVHRG